MSSVSEEPAHFFFFVVPLEKKMRIGLFSSGNWKIASYDEHKDLEDQIFCQMICKGQSWYQFTRIS